MLLFPSSGFMWNLGLMLQQQPRESQAQMSRPPRSVSRGQPEPHVMWFFMVASPGFTWFGMPSFVVNELSEFISVLRNDCKAQVSSFSGSIFRGYKSREDAEEAFIYATDKGWLRGGGQLDCQRNGTTTLPVERMNYERNPINRNENDKEPFWYVVYHGLQPGIYRSQ